MARRSSARLRNRNSSTPKRVSLSHDAPNRTPKTAPVKLAALRESDENEMPGAFPDSASPPPKRVAREINKQTKTVPVNFDSTTPKDGTPIKPSDEEMHPKQHHESTAKPMDEARWLGFANIAPHTEPPKQSSKIATLQGTPTRAPKSGALRESPKFRFTFCREQSLELSPDAKKLMDEKRQEAIKIREQMAANGEDQEATNETSGRKIATPKSKKGRFSDAHMEQFKKMESIAGHASSYRMKSGGTPNQSHGEIEKTSQAAQSPSKSLKRSPSKARLDEPDQDEARLVSKNTTKPSLQTTATHLHRSTSKKNVAAQSPDESPSPAKRVKQREGQDVSIARSPSTKSGSAHPSTPQQHPRTNTQPTYPDLSHLASPTQASLARTASVKSTKIPAPTQTHTPAKPAPKSVARDSPKPSTPLLARSPSKGSLFNSHAVQMPKEKVSPLLKRSPLKASPLKNGGHSDVDKEDQSKIEKPQLLAKSPLKMSVIKNADHGVETDSKASSSGTPFLARSPAKINLPADDATESQASQIPTKSPGGGLMGRFNLLRSSPMKSILRSPHRLYSNDPAKVAAGTHLATPPKFKGHKLDEPPSAVTPTASAEKHVDFTSSTKARHERATSNEASSTPSKGPTPSPKHETSAKSSPKPMFAAYPELPQDNGSPMITPQKRRQTAAPSDFTFTTHGHGITFGQSPNAPASASKSKQSPTIRHVSAEPALPQAPAPATGRKKRKFEYENETATEVAAESELPPAPAPATGSKKRKFDFENETATEDKVYSAASDKENAEEGDEERPAKRMKPSEPSPAPTKPASRPPTLGVKPKKSAKEGKDKKPATISQARLNALAQPKRRG